VPVKAYDRAVSGPNVPGQLFCDIFKTVLIALLGLRFRARVRVRVRVGAYELTKIVGCRIRAQIKYT
jgi:hypothetical protein